MWAGKTFEIPGGIVGEGSERVSEKRVMGAMKVNPAGGRGSQ